MVGFFVAVLGVGILMGGSFVHGKDMLIGDTLALVKGFLVPIC